MITFIARKSTSYVNLTRFKVTFYPVTAKHDNGNNTRIQIFLIQDDNSEDETEIFNQESKKKNVKKKFHLGI